MKKSTLLLTGFLSLTCANYAQESFPLNFEGNIRTDIIRLKNHDSKKHLLFHGEADLAVSASTADLGLYNGGEIFVQGMGILGNQASANFVGDIQVFSNIESDNRIFLYQVYYKHTFNKVILKLGQLDLNADYLVSSWASPMINSSFGVIPTISLNMPVSIFAYLAPGVSFKYLQSKQFVFQTAFFSGNPGDFETNRHNLRWNMKKQDGWFNITEFQFKTKSDLRLGRYKAGFFYHSVNPQDPESISSAKGNPGFYIIGDQQITFEKNTIKNGLSLFYQLSLNLAPENMVRSYYSMGLMYRGMLPRMNEDEFTVALASANLGKSYLTENTECCNHETAIEITYKKYIMPSWIIQPDFQYIINPGATNLYAGNTTVFLIRTIYSF